MRLHKKQRRAAMPANEPIFPTYELVLSAEEEARAVTKTLENVERGSKLMMKCTMEEGKFEKLVFRVDNREIGGDGLGSSKSHQIESFTEANAGIYECGAIRKSDKKYHSRQLRVTQKRVNILNLPPCDQNGEEFCGDHGACFLDGERRICHCDDGYMGESCDKVLMTAYDGTIPVFPIKILKVVGGTTTSLNVVCIFVAILFALLYIKEKTAKRHLRRQVNEAYEECEKQERNLEATVAFLNEQGGTVVDQNGFARNSMKKMRLAFQRARLNGTSDSMLIEK